MKKSDKLHLENITVENLMEFRQQSFLSFASSSGNGNRFELGVNGLGQFVVKANEIVFKYSNPARAIELYSDFIKNKEQ